MSFFTHVKDRIESIQGESSSNSPSKVYHKLENYVNIRTGRPVKEKYTDVWYIWKNGKYKLALPRNDVPDSQTALCIFTWYALELDHIKNGKINKNTRWFYSPQQAVNIIKDLSIVKPVKQSTEAKELRAVRAEYPYETYLHLDRDLSSAESEDESINSDDIDFIEDSSQPSVQESSEDE